MQPSSTGSSAFMEYDESYLDAQRAAVESVAIGRTTLQQAQQQNEQLHRASSIADETQYSLDQAARLLKNMTWSGWIANKFSKDPRVMRETTQGRSMTCSSDSTTRKCGSQSTWRQDTEHDTDTSNIPKSCQAAFQAIQNYRANLQVLEDCEHKDQLFTCLTICNTMHAAAREKLKERRSALSSAAPMEKALCLQMDQDLDQLRHRQDQILALQTQRLSARSPQPAVETSSNSANHTVNGDAESLLLKTDRQPASLSSATPPYTASLPMQLQQRKQEEHLEFISQNLDELGDLAQHLHEAVHTSGRTMDRLDEQSEGILEQTKHVTRRADRLARHKKGWVSRAISSSMQLLGRVAFQHIESGRYLRVSQGTVFLVTDFEKPTCTMGIYSSQRIQNGNGYGLVGIKNLAECTWLGQSLFGSLDASATTFAHRQEWELDDGTILDGNDANNNDDGSSTRTTRLLCASAGWGTGGYIMVGPPPHFAMTIGGSTLDEKKKAAMWRLVNQPL